ncbi:MAG: anaerobic ribonucleoside-triphosphate reductase activating protein [Campylobacter sp.]|nr:anaerobic ribonucleoside-triphosphate reductase activating protein [Campylobacter sp.]
MIHSITPFTTTDYPGKLACIAWFAGCNMRCVYCYNDSLVLSKGSIDSKEFINFLKSRVDKLDGVVFSGGECTLSPEFNQLAKETKALGFSLKVDTNGSNVDVLKKAIEDGLIDYIALDFKTLKSEYKLITKTNLYDNFIQTLKYLISINFDFEVRTTVHADFINENDVSKMSEILEKNGYTNTYYLQNFLETGTNFGALQNPKASFDPSMIKTNLKIELRNF